MDCVNCRSVIAEVAAQRPSKDARPPLLAPAPAVARATAVTLRGSLREHLRVTEHESRTRAVGTRFSILEHRPQRPVENPDDETGGGRDGGDHEKEGRLVHAAPVAAEPAGEKIADEA